MSNSYNYKLKPDLTDAELLEAVTRVRFILDALRQLEVQTTEDLGVYVDTYDNAQAAYEAALDQARERRLTLEEWEGDAWLFVENHWERM